MRNTGIFGILSLAALMMAGCQADESLDKFQGQVPIYLTATVIESQGPMVTRAGADVQSTQLANGATFTAEFSGDDVSVASATYTADGAGGANADPQPYFTLGGSSTTVTAYAPSKPSGTFTVQADQSTDAAYLASDLMYATATVQKSNPVGALTFTHRMAKIIVNAKLGDGISSITAVKIIGGLPSCELSGTDCTVGDASGTAFTAESPLTVFSGNHSSGTLSCAALIPPQTVTGNFLVITTDQGDITYSLDSKVFGTGQTYGFNVTVSSADVGSTIAFTGWDDNGSVLIFNGGVEAVDLGLPSGTLWANMNVGATSETDYGMFFMWGDVAGHPGVTTEGYYFGWTNYKWWSEGDGEGTKLSKYVPTDKTSYWGGDGDGDPDNKLELDLADDAATANWGSPWRMPTQTEMKELVDNTDNEWTTINNVTGRKFMKKSDQSVYIFLPAAGFRINTNVSLQGSNGFYWSSTLYSDNPSRAFYLYFDSNLASVSYDLRYLGFTVRPVKGPIAPALGDPYYSDGTWGNNPHAANAEVIGIVAWLGSDSDLKCGKSHGLVMAKSDVSSTQTWGPTSSDESFLTNTSTIDGCRSNNKNGLTNTNNLIGNSHTHNAASQARAYTPAAPSTSGNTNWFLPSAAQWLAVLGPDGIGKQTTAEQVWGSYYDSDQTAYNNIKNALTASGVGGTALQYSTYWSSSEYDGYGAVYVLFYNSPGALGGVHVRNFDKDYNYSVRAFLAF